MVCYAEVLFQSSFSLCRSTRCLRNMRLPTRWLGYGLRNEARRASRNVTVHRLSAHSQDLLSTAHLHDSRLYKAKGAKTCCAHHPCIDRPILCCLLSQYTRNPSWSTLGLHFAQQSSFFFFALTFPFPLPLEVVLLPTWLFRPIDHEMRIVSSVFFCFFLKKK